MPETDAPKSLFPLFSVVSSLLDEIIRPAGQGSIGLFLVIATHNRDSILRASERLLSASAAPSPSSSSVHFAQINGMSDQLSLGLSRHGLSCLKLLPCGSVAEVLPWLAREGGESAVDVFSRESVREFGLLSGS